MLYEPFADMLDDERDFKLRIQMKARRNDWFLRLQIRTYCQ